MPPAPPVFGLLTAILLRIAFALRQGCSDAIGSCWSFLGSAQLRTAVLVGGLLCVIYIAQQAATVTRALETVATAQQVTGYAVMRQLQAAGWTPGAAAAPAAHPPVPHAIDPRRLEASAPSAGPTVAPSSPAAHR